MAENASEKPSRLERFLVGVTRVASAATEKAVELKVKYDSLPEGTKAALGISAMVGGLAFNWGPVDDILKMAGAGMTAGVAKRYCMPNVSKGTGYLVTALGVAAALYGMRFNYSYLDDAFKIGGVAAATFFCPSHTKVTRTDIV